MSSAAGIRFIRNSFRHGLITLCVLVGAAAPALAHPVPFSFLDLHLPSDSRTEIDGSLVVHIFDVAHDLEIGSSEALLEQSWVDRRAGAIVDLLTPRLALSVDGRTVPAEWSQVEILEERQSLRVHLRFRLKGTPGVLIVTTTMFPYDPVHQTFVNIYDGDGLTQAILDRNRNQFEYFSGSRQGTFAVIRKFIPAGLDHILIGPDHLLFLVGLLLLGGRIRHFVFAVTAFTVANSITLSLAAFNIITPPTRIIEPAVALSIVYVGLDNLTVQNGRDTRAWIALAFGLIHGLGFASVLREMNLPTHALGWSLFSFNFGVEIGQLLVVAVVASALAALRSRSEAVGRRLAFAGSIVVVVAGAFWFIQRVFFPGGLS